MKIKNFKEYITSEMQKHNLSQARVAQGLGISDATISKYINEEKGYKNPKLETQLKFEKFFKYIEKKNMLHKKLLKNIEALSSKQYKKVKEMRLNGGLFVTDSFDERLQIFAGIEDSFFILAEKINDAALLEQTIENWRGGDWDTTAMCMIVNNNL